VCGGDGVAVFDALHRRHKAGDAILYAFDLLEFDGEDFRPLPLAQGKAQLARLLARMNAGIAVNEHTDDDGAVVFGHACTMGLEGIVSKRLTQLPDTTRTRARAPGVGGAFHRMAVQ
jgi:bifunctional non-homologous end joining protein LigD